MLQISALAFKLHVISKYEASSNVLQVMLVFGAKIGAGAVTSLTNILLKFVVVKIALMEAHTSLSKQVENVIYKLVTIQMLNSAVIPYVQSIMGNLF